MTATLKRSINREITNQLKEQEKIIRDRMDAIEEAALAFRTIRDQKLYRLTYRTFDGYCRAVWGFGKDKAYRLIKHAEISSLPGSSMSQNATTTDTGGSKLDSGPDTQMGAQATTDEEVTSRVGGSNATEVTGESPQTNSDEAEPLLDDHGIRVPSRLIAIFENAPLFRRLTIQLNRLASSLAEVENTPAYQIAVDNARKLGGQVRQYSSLCRTAARWFEDCRPAIVCPACSGTYETSPDNDACARCGDKGYLTAQEVKS
jgi:hypothetical protein